MPKKLNANALKLAAIAAMTIDHLTSTFFPGYDLRWWVLCLHAIGRITAPIMWFFIAEGYHFTHNKRNYALRLLLLACISHFAYAFCFRLPMLPFSTGDFFNQTSVLWPLFLGLMTLTLFDVPDEKIPQWLKWLLFAVILVLAFPSDWSCIPVLAICWINANRGNRKRQLPGMVFCVAVFYVPVYCIFINFTYGLLQLAVVLSVPLLALYNGERGKWRGMKWFFYLYYPAHLFLCGVLRVLLEGGILLP